VEVVVVQLGSDGSQVVVVVVVVVVVEVVVVVVEVVVVLVVDGVVGPAELGGHFSHPSLGNGGLIGGNNVVVVPSAQPLVTAIQALCSAFHSHVQVPEQGELFTTSDVSAGSGAGEFGELVVVVVGSDGRYSTNHLPYLVRCILKYSLFSPMGTG
jgi:hypothetical protein